MKLFCVLAASALLTGCAFSVYDTPVNYTYSSSVAEPAQRLPALRVGEISDAREVKNPRMILNQRNGYNQETTGGWQAEKNLSEIVRDALVAGAEKYAALGSANGQAVLLSGELTDVSEEIVTGFWSGQLTMKVTVRMTATDGATGQILWRDTITGEAKNAKGNDKVMITSAFSGALTNLVDKLYTDAYLRQQLTRAASAGSPTS